MRKIVISLAALTLLAACKKDNKSSSSGANGWIIGFWTSVTMKYTEISRITIPATRSRCGI
jgi:hypothetical protein